MARTSKATGTKKKTNGTPKKAAKKSAAKTAGQKPTRKKASQTATTRSQKETAPWDESPPRGTRKTKLSPASKAEAKASAKRAGRPYPSLVDNMNAAKKQKAKRKTTAQTTAKTSKRNTK